LDNLFATETMAELSARQGRVADAVAIYRHLVGAAAGSNADVADAGTSVESASVQRWKARIAELEGEGAAAGEVPGAGVPAPARAPAARAVIAPAATPAHTVHRPSLVVAQPVRSGQVIYAEGRDLIVVAAVHSGAQLLADGHIHVYGALKGRAIAGAHGARDAQVFCLALEAELVGVDTGYAISEDIPPALWGGPARISLTPEGICSIVALPSGKRR
jgi:septum site-determining protein MinC